jgi:hypothetical protein
MPLLALGIDACGAAKPGLDIGLGFPVSFARRPFRPPPNRGPRTSEIGSGRVARGHRSYTPRRCAMRVTLTSFAASSRIYTTRQSPARTRH